MHRNFVPSLKLTLLIVTLLISGGLTVHTVATERATAYAAPAFSCGDVSEISNADCLALQDLYNATDGNRWTDKTDWLVTNTPCTWYGVTCGGGRVIELRLQSNGLKGTLPPTLSNLSALTWLELQYNTLSGEIPPGLGSLNQLTELSLYYNSLTGSIPPQLGGLSNLNALRLGHNKLTGNVPKELGALSNLTILGIDDNQLTGPLPTALGNLTKLELFNADLNQLNGTIPSIFGNFGNIWRLWLENNQFSGELPGQLGSLSKLRQFSVRNNALKDAIPSTFTGLTALGKLDLGYNQFTASGTALKNFLAAKDPDWADTQTIAPTNLTAATVSANSIKLSWTPIVYTGDGGYYEIRAATTPGGPYTTQGATTNKNSSNYTVSGLTPNTTYYFVVRSYTPAHGTQQNTLWSAFSNEASATTENDTTLTPPTIVSTPETKALRGQAYAYSVIANGSVPLTFSLPQNPLGMTIDANTGFISWTPATVGAFAVTVKASNSVGANEQSFTITVNETPKITSAPLTSAN
ncbi:MAG: fibronectin type III domain-containing protein, partial [Caldilineaceae bacterium]|nr:fibronectin type III domain-containing protein [Caldilineaceae bacterium]